MKVLRCNPGKSFFKEYFMRSLLAQKLKIATSLNHAYCMFWRTLPKETGVAFYVLKNLLT